MNPKTSLRLAALVLCACATTLAGQTQREMNAAACDAFHKADLELTHTIDRILAANKSDTDFAKAFRAAQDAWITYRDAHIKALYPSAEPNAYGSVNPMCRCSVLEQLTKDRTTQIRNLWIRGTLEGDVCAGSLPIRQTHAPQPKRK